MGFARNLILFLFEREREGFKRFAACTVYSGEKDRQHIELLNSQKIHNRWTSLVYIITKVCQLRLQDTSFATRGQKWVNENWP